MKLSSLDLRSVRALYHLLEEAHVGRAARLLGITPAAASNALRRLRVELGDPLLIKKGRGLVRTRVGDDLLEPARAVMSAAVRLEQASRPFNPATFNGQLSFALSDHVAAVLLPELDRLICEQAPGARLAIAPIPDQPREWLERTGGVMVIPSGASPPITEDSELIVTPLYQDNYVVAMRSGNPLMNKHWNAENYAAAEHVLVVPRGKSMKSDVDAQLASLNLTRRIVRVVPSFPLALSLVIGSDRITTLPKMYADRIDTDRLMVLEPPVELQALEMAIVSHRSYENNAVVRFASELLKAALAMKPSRVD